jgi:hypothetical protein
MRNFKFLITFQALPNIEIYGAPLSTSNVKNIDNSVRQLCLPFINFYNMK